MRLPLLLSLGLLGLGQQAAQAQQADTARFYRHHLGLAASPQLDQFFTANRRLPVTILYKRQTAANKLWRLGLTINQNYSSFDEYRPPSLGGVNSNDEFTNRTWGIGLLLGREFTHSFSRRWVGTTGTDVAVGYSYNYRETVHEYVVDPSTGNERLAHYQYYRRQIYQASVAPFVGLRFNIAKRLYATSETAVVVAYQRNVLEGNAKVVDLDTGELINGSNSFSGQLLTNHDFTTTLRLINQISLHYMLSI